MGSIYTKIISITRQEALRYALQHNNVGLSVSGGYAGASGSVSVNVDRLTQDRSFTRRFNYKSHENDLEGAPEKKWTVFKLTDLNCRSCPCLYAESICVTALDVTSGQCVTTLHM